MNRTRPNDPCWCGSGKKYKRCHRSADLEAELGGASPGPAKAAVMTRAGQVLAGKVSPRRAVPAEIARPDYADSGRPRRAKARLISTPAELERMRRAGRAAREVLEEVRDAVRVGITTDELDAIGHEAYLRRGGYPSPLNYHGFPKSLCTSVNEVICHGIPDSRPLEDGDIVNVDITIFLDGVHGDCSETIMVGKVDETSRKLARTSYECMMLGIEAVHPGGKIRDIGRAIQTHATRAGFSVVQAFVGHGIGETFHCDPQVPHYYDVRFTTPLRPGMTFTIEPMINEGVAEHRVWDDNWTAVTVDLRRSAQFEHTIFLGEDGVEILTRGDEPSF